MRHSHLYFIISAGRIELPFTASKTVVLPLNETELFQCPWQGLNLQRQIFQTCVLSSELQRRMISAERIELPLPVPETGVLPLDETEW